MKEFSVKLIEQHEKVVTHKVYAETETEAIEKAEANKSHTRTEANTFARTVVAPVLPVKEPGKQWTTVTK